MAIGTFGGEQMPVNEKDRARTYAESLLKQATAKRDSLKKQIDYYKKLPRTRPPTGGPAGDGGGDIQDWNRAVGSYREDENQRDYYLSDEVEEELRRLDDRVYELEKDIEAILADDEVRIGNYLI